MNWNKLDKSWKEFCTKHQIKLNTKDQHLFPVPMKQTEYTAVETIDGHELHYFYQFYKGDNLKLSNCFKIAVRVKSSLTLRITRNSRIKKLIHGKPINIECETNLAKEIGHLHKVLLQPFSRFPDLEIKLAPLANINKETIKGNEYVFQILTKKHLPEETDCIELLRDTIMQLIEMFKGIVNPKHIEADKCEGI